MKKMYRLLTHYKKIVPKIVPLWLKNRNQRVYTGGLMRGSLIRGRAYTWSNTSAKEKVGLLQEGLYAVGGRGGYRRRNKVFELSILT